MFVYVCNIVVISKTRSNRFHKHNYLENWIWRVNLILGWLELELVAFCVLDGLSKKTSDVPWRNMMWTTVNIWYLAPSHQFLKSVLSFFQVLVYKQMLSFFEEWVYHRFPSDQFPKNKDVSNTTLH